MIASGRGVSFMKSSSVIASNMAAGVWGLSRKRCGWGDHRGSDGGSVKILGGRGK